VAEGWAEAARRAGVLGDAPIDMGAISAALWNIKYRWKTGRATTLEFAEAIAREESGMSVAQVLAMFDAMMLGMYPRAAELLAAPHRTGIRTACLSNTNDRHWDALMADPAYEAVRRVDYLFPSHLIHHAKPEAEAYRFVEKATRTVPQGILFFDDLEENVAAARQCGWTAEWIPPDLNPPGRVMEHLKRYGVLERSGASGLTE